MSSNTVWVPVLVTCLIKRSIDCNPHCRLPASDLTIRNLLLLQDKECKATKVFGDSQSGVLASYPGETFDLSQIYNLTQSSMKSDGQDLSSLFSNFLDTATPESAAESAASVAASG